MLCNFGSRNMSGFEVIKEGSSEVPHQQKGAKKPGLNWVYKTGILITEWKIMYVMGSSVSSQFRAKIKDILHVHGRRWCDSDRLLLGMFVNY